MAWVVERAQDIGKLPRIVCGATPQAQMSTSGLYDWLGGIWSVQGGYGLPATATFVGGTGYTGTPTSTTSGMQGLGPRKQSLQSTLSVSAGAITGILATSNTGLDLITLSSSTITGTGTGASEAVSGTKARAPGTIGVTNGSNVWTSTSDLTSFFAPGEDFTIFGTDQTSNSYTVKTITSTGGTLGTPTDFTVSKNYAGTTAAATTAWYGGNIACNATNLNGYTQNTANTGQGPLVRPKGVATQDQRVTGDFQAYIATVRNGLITRYNDAPAPTGVGYQAVVDGNLNTVSINYAAGDGTQVVLKSSTFASIGLSSLTVGHDYRIDFSAVNSGTSNCTLTAILTDLTSSTTYTAVTYVDSNVTHPLTLAAGQCGVMGFSANAVLKNVTTYNFSGLFITPSQVDLDTTASLSVRNDAATWLTTGPVFSASGTDASIQGGTTVVIDNTHATVTLNTGTFAGTITISDATSGGVGTLASIPMIAPGATVDRWTITELGCTVRALTYPIQGVAPYTAKVFRLPHSNALYTDPGAVQVGATQSGIPDLTIPNPVTDTTAPPQANFYVFVITDSVGQTVQGAQAGARPYVAPARNLGFMGDSNTDGHGASAQWANAVGVVSSGTGQTDGAYNITVPAGQGFLGKAHISGGLNTYCSVVTHGWGFTSETSEPVPVYSGAGGTPGVLSFTNTSVIRTPAGNIGGGFALILQLAMQAIYGFTDFNCLDAGIGGSSAFSSLPHGSVLVAAASNASPVVVTTKTNHNMTEGGQYPFQRIQGNTAANGNWYVHVIDALNVALYQNAGLTVPVVGSGAYSADTGGAIGPGTSSSGYIFEAAMDQFVDGSTTPWVHILYGTNDANGGVSKADYQQALDLMVYNIGLRGHGAVISYPLYQPGMSQAANYLFQQYATACAAVIAMYPGQAIAGMTNGYGTFLNNPFLFQSDGIHLTDVGDGVIAANLAKVVAPLYSLANSGSGVLFMP